MIKQIIKLKNSRKGQFQMLEGISFLIVFIILISFIGIIYFSLTSSNVEHKREVFIDERASKLSEEIFLLPEFECAGLNTNNCIDLFKALAFDETVVKSDFAYYYEIMGDVRVELDIIYPDNLFNEFLIFDGTPNSFNGARLTIFPVNIYDASTNTVGFALLKITYYD